MLLELGTGQFDVDVDATVAMYKNMQYIYQNCICPSCRNYSERVLKADPRVLKYLRTLGITPTKPQKAWAYMPGDLPETQQYLCYFPIVAKALVPLEDFVEVFEGFKACIADMEDGTTALVADWCMSWLHV